MRCWQQSFSCSILRFCHAKKYLHYLKGRQPEGVSAILHSEDGEQEAVHGEHGTTPDNDHDGLNLGICDAWNLESERDCGKGKDAVCE